MISVDHLTADLIDDLVDDDGGWSLTSDDILRVVSTW